MNLSEVPFLAHRVSQSEPLSRSSVSDEDKESFNSSDLNCQTSNIERAHPTLSSLSNNNWTITCRILILLLAIWGFLSALTQLSHYFNPAIDIYRPSTFPKDYNLCKCGTNSAEARAQGCIYDSMSGAFLPSYCRDSALTLEFEHSGPNADGSWSYFADANGTIPISIDEISMLEGAMPSFWATREWHIAHCLWYWEKYVRMRNTGIVMEKRFDSVMHTRHCRRMALRRNMNPDSLVEVFVVFDAEPDEVKIKKLKETKVGSSK